MSAHHKKRNHPDQKEHYGASNNDNYTTNAMPIVAPITTLQDTQTSCTDCASIYNAKKIRTDYDRFWMQFYNNKAQNTPTDLMDLQFAA